MARPTRSFEDLLAFSRAAQPMFDAAYRLQWKDALARISRVEDVVMQKKGIDVVIELKDGNRVLIDEKAEAKDTGNFFIEAVVAQQNPAGWISKATDVDFLAYGFVDTSRVYLIPLPLLRVIFEEWRDEWKNRGLERTLSHGGVKTVGYIPSQAEVQKLLCQKMAPVSVGTAWRIPTPSLPLPLDTTELTTPSLLKSHPDTKKMPLASASTLRGYMQTIMDSSPSSEKG